VPGAKSANEAGMKKLLLLACVLALSACPQDMIPINGTAMRPTEAHVEILD